MATLQERLAMMAGVQLTEAQLNPKIQKIYIKLFDVGMEDQPDGIIHEFVAKAVETQDVLTVDDWNINRETEMLEFVPMLRYGEVPLNIAKEFRDYMIDFLSDPENMETYESVQERKLTPAELEKREEVAKAIEKEQPGIDKSKKMAIATAQAKKMSEGEEVDEAAIGEPWVVHMQFRKEGDTRTISSANYKLNAPDKERAKSYATADFKKKGYTDVKAVRATPVKSVKEANYDDEGNVVPDAPLPQGLAEIARKMGFETLDTRNSDGQDFKEVAVWSVKDALLAAYNLGKSQGEAQATPAEQQPQSGGLPAPTPRTSADHQQAGPIGTAR